MSILALDLGTRTGVAYGAPGVPACAVQCETWALPAGGGEDVGPIMHALRGELLSHMFRVRVLIFEAPFVPNHLGLAQVRRAYGFAALCEEIAFAHGAQCFEVVTSTIKKEFASHGRADKAAMIAAARRRGFIVANDHEADAAACWLHGAVRMVPACAALYDPLFAGARP